jgi:hypothetical protein
MNFEFPKETMSLNGGIDTYSIDFKRYGSEVSPKGRKVKFLNKNGYDGERKWAAEVLRLDEIYTIEEIYVGRSSSAVELQELPDKRFNTVMFEDVE